MREVVLKNTGVGKAINLRRRAQVDHLDVPAEAGEPGLVICREFARHRIRRVPYIGVPRAVVERRTQRGQLIGGAQAQAPLYVPYADFYQFQAGAGRLAAARA